MPTNEDKDLAKKLDDLIKLREQDHQARLKKDKQDRQDDEKARKLEKKGQATVEKGLTKALKGNKEVIKAVEAGDAAAIEKAFQGPVQKMQKTMKDNVDASRALAGLTEEQKQQIAANIVADDKWRKQQTSFQARLTRLSSGKLSAVEQKREQKLFEQQILDHLKGISSKISNLKKAFTDTIKTLVDPKKMAVAIPVAVAGLIPGLAIGFKNFLLGERFGGMGAGRLPRSIRRMLTPEGPVRRTRGFARAQQGRGLPRGRELRAFERAFARRGPAIPEILRRPSRTRRTITGLRNFFVGIGRFFRGLGTTRFMPTWIMTRAQSVAMGKRMAMVGRAFRGIGRAIRGIGPFIVGIGTGIANTWNKLKNLKYIGGLFRTAGAAGRIIGRIITPAFMVVTGLVGFFDELSKTGGNFQKAIGEALSRAIDAFTFGFADIEDIRRAFKEPFLNLVQGVKDIWNEGFNRESIQRVATAIFGLIIAPFDIAFKLGTELVATVAGWFGGEEYAAKVRETFENFDLLDAYLGGMTEMVTAFKERGFFGALDDFFGGLERAIKDIMYSIEAFFIDLNIFTSAETKRKLKVGAARNYGVSLGRAGLLGEGEIDLEEAADQARTGQVGRPALESQLEAIRRRRFVEEDRIKSEKLEGDKLLAANKKIAELSTLEATLGTQIEAQKLSITPPQTGVEMDRDLTENAMLREQRGGGDINVTPVTTTQVTAASAPAPVLATTGLRNDENTQRRVLDGDFRGAMP